MRRVLLLGGIAALALPASASAAPRFAGSTLPVAGGASRVAGGDFDGDGRDDLAIGGATKVTIRLGIAAPSDAGPSTKFGALYDVGATVNDIAAADLNQDGRDDLIVARAGTAPAVYMTTASSTLPSALSVVAGVSNASEVEAAELEGDSDVDLVFLNGSAALQLVGSSTPAGATAFTSDSSVSSGAITSPHDLVVAPVRGGDAKPDFSFIGGGGSDLYTFQNTSTPGFVGFGNGVTAFEGANTIIAATTRKNALGESQFVYTTQNGTITTVGNGTPTTLNIQTVVTTSPAASALAAGPLDGQSDGDEIVALKASNDTATIYEDAVGANVSLVTLPVDLATTDRAAIAGLSGDSIPDIAMTHIAGKELGLLASVGRFGVSPTTVTFAGTTPVGLTSDAQTVTLTNTGWAPLSVLGALTSTTGDGADFSVDASDCLTVLLPLSLNSCSIQVRFTPSATGARSGTIRFITPLQLTDPTVTLNGTGAATPTGATGPQGPVGNPGSNGTNGSQGAAGANGATGPAGTNGTNGAAGPAGDTGATGPKGRDATPACENIGKSKRTVCRVTIGLPLTTRVTARLTKGGKTYATGAFKGVKKAARLTLTSTRALKPGTYRLALTLRPSGRKATTVAYAVRVN